MTGYRFETINCILCGSEDKKSITDKGLYGLPAHVVLCKKCGLGYLSPRWDAESYFEFYRNEYDTYYRPALNNKKYVVPEKNNLILTRLKQCNLLPGNIHSILDIGSGEGQNLLDFKLKFPRAELFAIEVSPTSIQHLYKNNVDLVSENFESSWNLKNREKFDFIIMRHVLEHFMNPVAIMKKVKMVLSQEGLVYIAVPNNLNPISKLKSAWFRNVHTFYFNRFSLENLMKIVGMEIIFLQEGDEMNVGELFIVVKKASRDSPPEFSQKYYKKQLWVFQKALWRDNSEIYHFYKKYHKLYKKALIKTKILLWGKRSITG